MGPKNSVPKNLGPKILFLLLSNSEPYRKRVWAWKTVSVREITELWELWELWEEDKAQRKSILGWFWQSVQYSQVSIKRAARLTTYSLIETWEYWKKIGADYEQLLRAVFFMFSWAKNKLFFFKYCSVRTKKLHKAKKI